jgi:hypothetical protein
MNREIVLPGGAGVYPLIGDVASTAGNPTVVVVGLQKIPVQNVFPNNGANLEYNPNTNEWEPIVRASVQVNGLTVSDDPWMSVNKVKPITVNGA